VREIPSIERVDEFDERVDAAFDGVRKNTVANRVFYAASEAANHSVLWHTLAWTQALITKDAKRAVKISVALGIESAIVNGPLKMLFRRERPEFSGDRPHKLRTPRTSSFPSGHATSGFFAARLLSEGHRGKSGFYALSAIVATSRVFVRIHHASDIIAGAALGDIFGRIAQRLLRSR
jgi:membrane-associated phospholipid phosphatase